jgi:hypothetical protein
MQRLGFLGLHIANDTALCSRLARVLRFVADWHRPLDTGSDTTGTVETIAAAELAKVCQDCDACRKFATVCWLLLRLCRVARVLVS